METSGIIILVAFYLIGAIIYYRWITLVYSKGGINEYEDATLEDIVVIVLPLVNLFVGLLLWVKLHPQGKEYNVNRFFNIKK